jgi:hypothetical protein
MHFVSLSYEAWNALPSHFKTPLVIAYIDLGTGSMLLQMLVAGLLSVALTFKRLRLAVMGTLRRLGSGKTQPQSGAAGSATPDDPKNV